MTTDLKTAPERSVSAHDEILTVAEIARYLKVSERTILRMTQGGDLPSAKVSGQWRVVRSVVDEWLLSKMQRSLRRGPAEPLTLTGMHGSIPELVPPERILMNVEPGGKEAVLSQLIEPLMATGVIPEADPLLSKLLEREEMMSTAVGQGVALPHIREPKAAGIRQTAVVLGICREGTDFDALDNSKTYVLALLCATTIAIHLNVMANLSYVFRQESAVRKLRYAPNADEAVCILTQAQANLSP